MNENKSRKNHGAEVADAYAERIKEFLRGAYSKGYGNGVEAERDAIKNLRGTHKREAGEYDDAYAENWRDSTPFYGWCAGCKRPHSGRWAHVWEYCPWCGGKIDRTDEPYPMGRENKEAEEKTVTNAEEAEAYPISENITKGFEEFTKMIFKQGKAESEAEK